MVGFGKENLISDGVTTHLDIFPTIFDIMGLSKKFRFLFFSGAFFNRPFFCLLRVRI